MRLREWFVAHSQGDALGRYWALFRWRARTRSRLAAGILTYVLNRMAHRHGGYIGKGAVIADTPVLPHGLHGVYISRYAVIGAGCRIYQNVTIGEIDHAAPRIGAGCLIGAGAVLVGGITIGDRVKIGAGAVISTDVPDDSTVVCQPPRILQKE